PAAPALVAQPQPAAVWPPPRVPGDRLPLQQAEARLTTALSTVAALTDQCRAMRAFSSLPPSLGPDSHTPLPPVDQWYNGLCASARGVAEALSAPAADSPELIEARCKHRDAALE